VFQLQGNRAFQPPWEVSRPVQFRREPETDPELELESVTGERDDWVYLLDLMTS